MGVIISIHVWFIVLRVCVCVCRRTGKALSFITRENWQWARELTGILAEAGQVCVNSVCDPSAPYPCLCVGSS